jgi:hypothetical protein
MYEFKVFDLELVGKRKIGSGYRCQDGSGF